MRFFKLFFTLTILLSAQFFNTAQAAQKLDSILVEINDDIITQSELEQRIIEIKRQMASRQVSIPPADQLKKRILERMVTDRLQLDYAKRTGIKLDEVTLNKQIEKIARNNKMTMPQLRQTLLKQNLNFEQFRNQIRSDIIIQRIQKRQVYDRIKVSEREIKQLINRTRQKDQNIKFRISHILIATPEAASSEQLQQTRTRAENIHKSLAEGADFEQAAIKYSAGHRALEGGDLGLKPASELPSLFVNALNKMKPGDISPVLQSATGFHIIKLTESQSTDKLVVDETLARHILIKTDAINNDEKVRQQLTNIRKRILNGEDFASLAKQYSQDPGSKGAGGELGWAQSATYDKRFAKVMDSLKIRQLSEPFKSGFGWHIIEVLDRRKEDKTDIVLHNKAYKAIQSSKADEALQLWLRRIRDEAYIKFHGATDTTS